MVRSTEINAAHTHNHEAKDLSSGRRSEFLLATYSKYCLLEVSRVPDIRSLVILEALSQLWRATFGLMQIRGIHRHIRQQKAPTDHRERDTKGIFFFFQNCITICGKTLGLMLQIWKLHSNLCYLRAAWPSLLSKSAYKFASLHLNQHQRTSTQQQHQTGSFLAASCSPPVPLPN